MDKSRPLRILVIRLSAMGDVAMTVPVLLALLESYPTLQLTVLTRATFKPIFDPLGRVKVFPADVNGRHKGIKGLWRLYRELQKEGYDAIADLHHVLRTQILKIFFKGSAIPFVQINKGRAEKRALTSQKNKVFRQLTTTHQRYASVFEKLGFPVDLEKVELLSRQPVSESIRKITEKDHKKWIGVAPFAAFAGKQYPLYLMKEVLLQLINTNKYKIFLFGGKSEAQDLFADLTYDHENCVNMAGTHSFSEELALISNLDLMVSMDSGNAHLAANYGVPTLTLWGLTHPFAGFYPFGQDAGNALFADRKQYPGIPTSVYGKFTPPGYESAMESIAPEQVLQKIKALLED